MKKLTAILMTAVLLMTFFTGCGKKGRELYNKANLEKYVEVSDYLGIEVDTQTDEYKKYYNEIFDSDVTYYGLYNEVAEGTVADGDLINLDYEGKIDGVAFEGGTAQDADLEIGSGTFIDDFEEELIGVAVGATKDVTATFPTDYGNEELNGKEAVFTCKVNFIYKPMTEEEAYTKRGFTSVEEYIADISKRAIKQYILNFVCENSTIKDYPAEDLKLLGDAILEYYTNAYSSSYGVDFNELLTYNGTTTEEFKEESATEFMNVNMVMYYILDAQELEIYESTVNSQNVSQPVIAESYAVQDIVLEFLFENANVK